MGTEVIGCVGCPVNQHFRFLSHWFKHVHMSTLISSPHICSRANFSLAVTWEQKWLVAIEPAMPRFSFPTQTFITAVVVIWEVIAGTAIRGQQVCWYTIRGKPYGNAAAMTASHRHLSLSLQWKFTESDCTVEKPSPWLLPWGRYVGGASDMVGGLAGMGDGHRSLSGFVFCPVI